ncbi:MAG: methyltransferase, partial [Candidatus Aminicenantes bacterium]|nr:methyltransferase [Candidatus Aminicenantes bacterium]
MIGRIEAIGKSGRGIVFYEGKPVFLPGVLRGESVEFTISGKKHSILSGAVIRIIEAAKERVIPPCPYYEECGGCNFQHIAYHEQIAVKQDILKNNLKRIAKIDYAQPVEVITSPPSRYRTRIILKVRDGKAGFYKKGSHEIVEIETCLVAPQPVENFLRGLRAHNPGKGEIYIISSGKELSAVLKTGDAEKYLSDKKEISFEIGEFTYDFSPGSFIQANLFTLEIMLGLVQHNLESDYFEKAADLFCGAGFFTLALARRVRRVAAVEAHEENIRLLKANLAGNKIDNVEIIQADILKSAVGAADLFVIDPPRSGLNRRLVKEITGHLPKKILYFSCDSATFSRDIFYFREAGFILQELKIIDNFPQTDHFEIYSCLV